MNIQIFTTGGTIEGIDNTITSSKNQHKTSIASFLKSANVAFKYDIERVIEKDSREINIRDRVLLARKILASEASKILIPHGTFTMEETAQFLGKLNINKTIVLVGSFILGSLKNTDAPFNLGYAICTLQHLKSGVYIAMNGQIFDWQNATKNLKTNQFEKNDG